MIRSVSSAIGLVVLIATVGCGKLLAFDTDVSASGVVPGLLSSAGNLPAAIDASSSLSQAFDANGIDASKVQSLKITAGQLSATQSGGENHLGWFKSFEIYVSANGMDPLRIGQIDTTKFADHAASAPLTIFGDGGHRTQQHQPKQQGFARHRICPLRSSWKSCRRHSLFRQLRHASGRMAACRGRPWPSTPCDGIGR